MKEVLDLNIDDYLFKSKKKTAEFLNLVTVKYYHYSSTEIVPL